MPPPKVQLREADTREPASQKSHGRKRRRLEEPPSKADRPSVASNTSSLASGRIVDGTNMLEGTKNASHDRSIVHGRDTTRAGGNEEAQEQRVAVADPAANRKSDNTGWVVSGVAGGCYIEVDPIITKDEKHLILAQNSSVHIFSMTTSLLLRSLQVPNDEQISAYSLSTVYMDQLYVSTSSGSIYHWNWDTGLLIEELSSRPGVVDLVVSPSEPGDSQCDLLFLLRSTEVTTITVMRTKANSLDGELKEKIIMSSKKQAKFVRSGKHGKLLVIASSNHFTIGLTAVLDSNSLDSLTYVWREIPVTERIHCLDLFVRKEEQQSSKKRSSVNAVDIIVGGESGAIFAFDDMLSKLVAQEKLDNKRKPTNVTPRRLHWHRDAVKAVRFSADGNYVLSGGSETVLVLWQLDTGKRQFLPHLTSPIQRLTISSKGTSYAIKLGDNSIAVLSTSPLVPIANVCGVQARIVDQSLEPRVEKRQLLASENWMIPLSIVPSAVRSSNPAQLLFAVPSSQSASRGSNFPSATFLQTYDIHSNLSVSKQALTRTNTTNFSISPQASQIIEPDVKHLVTSHDGQWLASVDEWTRPKGEAENFQRDSRESSRVTEGYLKIWSWNAETKNWGLVTRIDSPHPLRNDKPGRVLAMVSNPHAASFASVGEDGVVKFWNGRPRKRGEVIVKNSIGEALYNWNCSRSIRLGPEPSDQPTGPVQASLAFSSDGSVLAVALDGFTDSCNGSIYFVDTLTGKIALVRDDLYGQGPVRLAFMGRHLLILSSDIRVYDTVIDALEFVSYIHAKKTLPRDEPACQPLTLLAANPQTETFAISIPIQNSPIADTSDKHQHKSSGLGSYFAVFTAATMTRVYGQILSSPITSLIATPTGYATLNAALTINHITPPPAISSALPTIRRQPSASPEPSFLRNIFGSGERGKDALIDRTRLVDDRNERRDQGTVTPEQLREFWNKHPSYTTPKPMELFYEFMAMISPP